MSSGHQIESELSMHRASAVCALILIVMVLKYACFAHCGQAQRASLEDPELPRMKAYARFKYHALPLVPPPASFL